jgi:hypothetical protein
VSDQSEDKVNKIAGSIYALFHFIGNFVLLTPSNAHKALATAAAVGTSPISPIPLAP